MKNAFLAGLSVFFYCVALTVFVFSFQIKILVNPEFLKSALNQAKIYDQINTISENIPENNDLSFNGFIKTFTLSIDKDLAKTEIEKFIDDFYSFLLGKKDLNSVQLDLTKVKADFKKNWTNLAPQIFADEYQKLPLCQTNLTPEQYLASTQITCRNEQISKTQFAEIVKTADISSFEKSIPDKITLQDIVNKNTQDLVQLRSFINLVFNLYIISFIILFISLIGIVLFAYPDIRSMFSKVGWPTFILNLPTIILMYFSNKNADFLKSIISNQDSNKIATAFTPLLEALSQNLFQTLIKLPLILCFVGLLLLIVSFFLPKIEEKVVPPGFENPSQPIKSQ